LKEAKIRPSSSNWTPFARPTWRGSEIALERVNRYLARLGQEPITAGGLLAFGHRPRHFLDHCGVTLVRYAGSKPDERVLDIAGTFGRRRTTPRRPASNWWTRACSRSRCTGVVPGEATR